MTPAERNAELLKKYGISSNPLPFDDVVSTTQTSAHESMKTMVVTEPAAKKIVVQLKPPAVKTPKASVTVIKPKRQYTKRSKVGENAVDLSNVSVKSLDLKLRPAPSYTHFFEALFPTAMEAASFSANYPDSKVEMDGFSHAVLVPLENRDDMVVVGACIKKAKGASATTYHIRSKTI